MFWEFLWEALCEALIDTAKVTLFLFLSYLLMELFEHKVGDRSQNIIKKAGKLGPLVGGFLGGLPQCGFSAAAAGLYAGRIISRGTLIAVFLATSDEMLPIMLSGLASQSTSVPEIVLIIGTKVVCGIAVGFLIDVLFRKNKFERGHFEEICEHEGCNCQNDGIWISSLKHTAKVALFLLLTTFAINLIVVYVGENNLGAIMHSVPVVGELIAALVGLIPNCASSVVITELYLGGTISASQMLAGLFVGAGVGLLVLFRTNRSIVENLIITAMLYVSGVALGLLVGATGLFETLV